MSRASSRSRVVSLETTLFDAADKLRQDMDAAEYKHVVLALIFLRSVERMESQIVVPEASSWSRLKAARWSEPSGQPGRVFDLAMEGLERNNPRLAGTLFRGFSALPIARNGRLVELAGLIDTVPLERGDTTDTLGHIYEVFLEHFAHAEGHRGGQFYTPRCVVELLYAMLKPTSGVLYDPCCGSGGMFVASRRSRSTGLRFLGQESNRTTWRLARMNLVLHDLDGDLGAAEGDTFLDDFHAGKKVDVVLSNPPFNAKDWGASKLGADARWAYGVPPSGNANYAWIQHILHHLADHGRAAVVLANGALTSEQVGEGEIRRALVDAGVVECIVSLPPQLFLSTTIPASVWCLSKAPQTNILFVDGSSMGTLCDRTHRLLLAEDIERIAAVYQQHRGRAEVPYEDVPGFCRVVSLEEVAQHRYGLVPGRYVGFEEPAPAEAVLSRIEEQIAVAEIALDRVGEAARFARELLASLRDGIHRG